MIISKTPLRISFCGGGTDLPSFYKNNTYGAVFSTSINNYIYVSVKHHSELYPERIRLNYSETEQVNSVGEIENAIIRETLKFLKIDDRIYISTVADSPASSGLGSSSAFCVGLLAALYKYRGECVSAGQLADEASHIEIDLLNKPIGKQDQYAAAFGGFNFFRFNADNTVDIRPTCLSADLKNEIASHMITFWTGKTRAATSILEEQNNNHEKNRELLLQMRTQAEYIHESMMKNTMTAGSFAKTIHEGWIMKKNLASNVSNSAIDEAYQAAVKAGALGGKISGAGGGGFLSVFASPSHHQVIIKTLEGLGLTHCKFKFSVVGPQVLSFD
jgi:D-glycero-alpha-D-manno-heptose-7-phosphate kinase